MGAINQKADNRNENNEYHRSEKTGTFFKRNQMSNEIQLTSAILHKLDLSSDREIGVTCSQFALNNNIETINLTSEVNKNLYSRTRSFITADEGSELRTIISEHIELENIVETSKSLLELLTKHFAESDTSDWGELNFFTASFRNSGRSYLMFSLIPEVTEVSSTNLSSSEVLLFNSNKIGVKKIFSGFLLDLTLLESSIDNPLAITMVKPRKTTDEEILLNALGCSKSNLVENQTKKFIDTITDFIATTELEDSEKKLIHNQIVDHVTASKSHPTSISDISRVVGGVSAEYGNTITGLLEKAGFDKDSPIQLDRKTAKSLRRIGWSDAGLNISFSPLLLGHSIEYDEENDQVIIKNIPSHIREKLSR